MFTQTVSRRNFIKAVMVTAITTVTAAYTSKNRSENITHLDHGMTEEANRPEYVIVDGWVLLKSDIQEG